MFPIVIVFLAIVAFFIYYCFSVWMIRSAAKRILENIRKNCTRERNIRIISPEALPPEIAEEYAKASGVVEGLGFKFVCCAEDETFTRANGIMIPFKYFKDDKNESKVAIYFHSRIGYTVYDFMTELSDGRQLTTNNATMAGKIKAPPILVRKHLPPDTPPAEILMVHREQLGKILGGASGITCSTAVTPVAILDRYRSDSKIRYDFNRGRGWISLEELIGMSPKGSEANARKIYAMIQKILKEEEDIVQRGR